MAQDDDLQILGGITAGEQHEQLDRTTQRQIGKSGHVQHLGWPPHREQGSVTLPTHASTEPASNRPDSSFCTLRAGYHGPVEVEIFNRELWALPGREAVRAVRGSFLTHA
jgi:hypothetical protein